MRQHSDGDLPWELHALSMQVAIHARLRDPRTVRKLWRGERVAPYAETAIKAAMAELGISAPQLKQGVIQHPKP